MSLDLRLEREAPRLDLIFFDAGGGHRASATALMAAIERQRRPWQVRMVNLRAVLDGVDLFKRIGRFEVENLYNLLLRYGMTLGSGIMLRTTQRLIRRMHSRIAAALAGHFAHSCPDLLVSLIPNFNRALLEGLRRGAAMARRPAPPMVTILTDMADYPPHFWIERQEQYLICGTAMARSQARAMGHPARRVFATSGMIVRPEFYDPIIRERSELRRELGLAADLPTGLVMFGGYGSRQMAEIARQAANLRPAVQLIFMCGYNRALYEQLAALRLPYPHHVAGFTRDIPRFMSGADFFVGKPGPGSISEALVMGLPVIVESNAWTMVQERYNTQWIAQNQAGIVLPSFAEIAPAIAQMADSRRLAQYRERIGRMNNRAVFEIPEILAGILAHPDAALPARHASALSA